MLTALKPLFYAGKNILKKVLKSFRFVVIPCKPVFMRAAAFYIII
jgi:hypothetical protein